MNAYDELARDLFSDPANLQVSPRRRFRQQFTYTSTGTAVVDNVSFISGVIQDTLQPADGLLFEFASIELRPPNTTVSIIGISMTAIGGPNSAVLAQPTATYPGPAPGTAAGQAGRPEYILTPNPKLWTSPDLNGLFGSAGALPASAQPLKFGVQLSAIDSNPASQAIPLILVVFYRLVRGLQEN